ncbi:MAG: phosphoribosylamine--glycine ligase [Bacteroidota bacterium]|nr:phosphoribosylamine--glycine ligase [Bacteroidota bacterium]
MNILLIGSGGREHAFSQKLTQSSLCSNLFVLPGNAGTSQLAKNVAIDNTDFPAIGNFCLEKKIELLIVGPEDLLVKGLRDFFESDPQLKEIAFVGPDAKGAQLEGSKDWSKAFMEKYNIPTAAYRTFNVDTMDAGIDYVKNHSLPVVLKADGLAAGKGVLICESNNDAVNELKLMIQDKKFGEAGSKVVVEAFLNGIELSVFVLTDGTNYKILPSAKDYKRIGEGDTGLNTGGMGAVSPVPFADAVFMQKVEERIIKPSILGLQKEQIHYTGFIFIGLMKVYDDPIVIEYNCRMGDPETEVVLPLIQNDFAELMLATAKGELDKIQLQIDSQSAATVMLVSKGYPGDYEKGKRISGLDLVTDSMLYHAGTRINENGELLSNGGRVMAVTSLGSNLKEALAMCMKNAEKIQFENKYYRKDIGYEFI